MTPEQRQMVTMNTSTTSFNTISVFVYILNKDVSPVNKPHLISTPHKVNYDDQIFL